MPSTGCQTAAGMCSEAAGGLLHQMRRSSHARRTIPNTGPLPSALAGLCTMATAVLVQWVWPVRPLAGWQQIKGVHQFSE
jgi:hypothetical protein